MSHQRITIFVNDSQMSYFTGKDVSGKIVKNIDAYLENSGVRITFDDGAFSLFSGNPFIFEQSASIKAGCEHSWIEISPVHDLKNQFNEQCEKCKLLRLWKYL